MRIIVILVGVVALGILGWKSFNKMIFPGVEKPKVEEKAPAVVALPPPAAVPGLPKGPPAAEVVPAGPPPPPIKVEAVGVYVFKNRPVPPAPFGRNTSVVGNGPDSRGLELSVDEGSNSWIFRGPPDQVEQTKRIGAFIDLEQGELDLDFCLVEVSADWLRRFGISAGYQNGAGWIDAFTLGGEGSTLRVSSGNFVVNVDAEASDSNARLVSAPVVRCITGEKWEFGADQQVPIATVSQSVGTLSTSYNYERVGLGFKGVVYKAGPSGSYRLTVEQRNGAVDSQQQRDNQPPSLKEQVLQTSLVVEVGRWSCLGGVTSWRSERSKRLLGFQKSEEHDLLLIFVRARDALQVAPRAYPVGPSPGHLDSWSVQPWALRPDQHPLLPDKNWTRETLDAEINRVDNDIRKRMGNPSK